MNAFFVSRTLARTHKVSLSLSNYLFTEQSHFTIQATALCSYLNER